MKGDLTKNLFSGWKELHHANIVAGDSDVVDLIENNLSKIGFKVEANPDYFLYQVDAFGIDEARILKSWGYLKPTTGDKKVAVVNTDSMTSEAQNALLKILEEPPFGTYIFIVLKNTSYILDTLKSRTTFLKTNLSTSENLEKKNDFWNLALTKRLQVIKTLIKEENKDGMRDIIKSAEFAVRKADTVGGFDKARKVLIAKKYINMRGSSPKMILEWLARSI